MLSLLNPQENPQHNHHSMNHDPVICSNYCNPFYWISLFFPLHGSIRASLMNQFWLVRFDFGLVRKPWALIRNLPCDLRNVAENAVVEGGVLKLSSRDVTATEDNLGGRYSVRAHSITENSRRETAKPPASRAFGEATSKNIEMRPSYTESLTCTWKLALHCQTLLE